MPWMKWKLWVGPVTGARIRVPQTPLYTIAYGPSENAIGIRSGAIGTVLNILPEGSSKPSSVQFRGRVNYSLAAEVLFRKADNSETMWKDFHSVRMRADECDVVIPYPSLDDIEIEYKL